METSPQSPGVSRTRSDGGCSSVWRKAPAMWVGPPFMVTGGPKSKFERELASRSAKTPEASQCRSNQSKLQQSCAARKCSSLAGGGASTTDGTFRPQLTNHYLPPYASTFLSGLPAPAHQACSLGQAQISLKSCSQSSPPKP
jgi:hypothetical protein